MLTKINTLFNTSYQAMIDNHRSKSENRYDMKHLACHIVPGAKLTKDEKSLIKKTWANVINCPVSRGYGFYLGLKCLGDFNPDYLPSSFFFPYIEGILNPSRYKKQLSHKSILQLVYNCGIKHPHTFLRSYGGILLDHNYKPLLLGEALDIIKNINRRVMYKPALDSECGRGIVIYDEADLSTLYQLIKTGEIFKSTDFVIQEVVTQSAETSLFNPTSLNCFRITTLNINDNVTAESRVFKCGAKNSFTDNLGDSKHGIFIGIENDGRLKPFGYYGNGEVTETHNGISLAGKTIGNFTKVVDTAIQLHKYVAQCKIIGWDIALDNNGDPILIEGNTIYPGISTEQICSGPIFGNRTQEVISHLDSLR